MSAWLFRKIKTRFEFESPFDNELAMVIVSIDELMNKIEVITVFVFGNGQYKAVSFEALWLGGFVAIEIKKFDLLIFASANKQLNFEAFGEHC